MLTSFAEYFREFSTVLNKSIQHRAEYSRVFSTVLNSCSARLKKTRNHFESVESRLVAQMSHLKSHYTKLQIKTVEVATACETRTRTFEVVSKNHSIILSHQKLSPLTLLIKVKVEIDNSFERDINNKDDCC